MGAILVRFRTHPIGISTDIEKAFLHVRLSEADRDMTRLLWLSDPTDPESDFMTYRFRSVLFGSASSPFMLNAVLQTHLDNHKTPVTQDMKENLYVDNVITGCNTDTEALRYYQESRSVMAEAKFNLRSWASNSPLLQNQAATDGVLDTDSGTTNILGLRWDSAADTLTLTSKEVQLPQDTITTKREILRESSKIYDPLGLITPVSIRAKILMQDIWQLNVDWDEPLDGDVRDRWISIAQDIEKSTNTATIPRRYFTYYQTGEIIQLHVFADASPKAYGAVAYIRQGNQITFVMAKTRVAPLKKLSLPRLELMAAKVGANLAAFLQNSLTKNFPNLQVFLWSDSQIVLHWLHSSKTLPQFVSNRVQEIKGLFPPSIWRYCPTSDNPADLLTRGVSADQLQLSTTWLHGPHWLSSECNWPTWESSTILLVENHEEDLDDAFPPDPQVNPPDQQVKPTSNKTFPP